MGAAPPLSAGARAPALAARAAALEAARGLAVAVLALGLLGLILALNQDALPQVGAAPWWATDANGAPLWDSFPDRAWRSLGLLVRALALGAPLSLVLAVLGRAGLSGLRWAVIAISCAPAFVLGYALFGQGPDLWLAALTLAVADLSLGGAVMAIDAALRRELTSEHARAAVARGGSLMVELWRPVLAAALLSLRARLPVLFAASVVVERIFGIPGLGDQASYSVLDLPDPVFLLWFAAFTVIFTRAATVAARAIEALILPRSRPPAQAPARFGGFFARSAARPRARIATAARAAIEALPSGAGPAPRRLGPWLAAAPLWLFAGALLLGALLVDPDGLYGALRHAAPGEAGHWLGTDGHQRDVLTQVLLGARAAGPWWALGVLIPLILGLLCGVSSGLGRLGGPLNLLMESLDALPKLVVILLLIAVLGAERYLVVGLPAMGLMFAPLVYTHVRDRVETLLTARFVEAEQAAGASWGRTLFVHIGWSNLRGVVLSCAATVLGGVVLLDATCGYLQIAQRDLCAWGALIYDNIQAWNQWAGLGSPFNTWSAIAPMTAATGLIITCVLAGEALALRFEGGRSEAVSA